MKITVLNGSPKVEKSMTMQLVYYASKCFPGHEFEIINITRDIGKIKGNAQLFDAIISSIAASDFIVWAFPVFGLFVPAEYKKFIELVWERNAAGTFAGKYAVALTTSIHFLDNYARYYINAVTDDLDMKYLGEYMADGDTLLQEEGRKNFVAFIGDVLQRVADQAITFKTYLPARQEAFVCSFANKNTASISTGKKVVILHNDDGGDSNLSRMVARFRQCFADEPEVISLKGLTRHGCMECYKCTMSNRCVFDGTDGFYEAYFSKVRQADIVVFADSIRDRHLSSEFKYFVDRCFVINHQPRLPGKAVGYIISGPLDQMPTLRHALEAWVEANDGSLHGFAGDWSQDSATVDRQLSSLAERLTTICEKSYYKSKSFEAVGTRKIYRDAVWGELRKVFVSDHIYYKCNGYYDFPQRSIPLQLEHLMFSVMNRLPAFRKWLIKSLPAIKVKKHLKVIASC